MREAPVSGSDWSPPCVAVASPPPRRLLPAARLGPRRDRAVAVGGGLSRSSDTDGSPARTSSGGRSATARALAGGDLGAADARVVGAAAAARTCKDPGVLRSKGER